MTSLVLLALMQVPTAPPLVSPSTQVSVRNPLARPDFRAKPELLPINNVVHFAPVSLFGLFASVEYERSLVNGITAFVGGGLGATAAYGLDLGLRHYVLNKSFEGVFAGLRLSGFGIINTDRPFLFGPGVEIGYSVRVTQGLVLSFAGGATAWWNVKSSTTSGLNLFSPLAPVPFTERVVWMPGLLQPVTRDFGFQPTVRLSIGPGF